MHNEHETLEADFSEHFLEMAFCTDLRKQPNTFHGYGKKERNCGDALEIFVDICDNVIIKLHYYSNGCFSTNACGNALAKLVVNKTITEAHSITPEDVAAFLETLPPHEFHCAEMAVAALYLALDNYHCHNKEQKP